MIALLQRVKQASVEINGESIGHIQQGLLIFAGFEPQDDEEKVSHCLERSLNYRIFADQNGMMNLSLRDIQGGLLLVPQFTLAADTRRGRRPSFTTAATPEKGRHLFDFFLEQAERKHQIVASGRFGADMQVHILNDGPVTFWLQN